VGLLLVDVGRLAVNKVARQKGALKGANRLGRMLKKQQKFIPQA
jgi:hypothetical protein